MGFSPNGRTVAAADCGESDTAQITLYEVSTGQEQASIKIASTYPMSLVFSPDGRALAMNSEKGVKLLNLPLLVGGLEPVQPASLPGLWDDLLNDDAARAYRAQCRLLLAGPETIRFLQHKLRPVREPSPDRLARLLQDLDNKRYAVRYKATQELEKLGEGAGPRLQQALERKPSLDVRRRIASLLQNQTDPRQDHALTILESIGDGPARQLLEQLAAGMPEARLTQNAKTSFDRLTKRLSAP